MVCSRCKKRPAVVFVTRVEGEENRSEGLCLTCARELGIKPVEDMLTQFGIGPEELEQMDEQMGQLMGGEESMDESPEGVAAFPFLKNLFGGAAGSDSTPDEKSSDRQSNGKKGQKQRKEPAQQALDAYCTDLTRKAREGQLDAIIGRDREIYRVIQILCRRTKNNPCLIGEPGVGKTAIAEGLALRIAAGQVPSKLRDKEVFLLDLTALVAGTQFRGQFENRIKSLINNVRERKNVILFIDEVHTLVSTGDCEGGMSAANILKPALSRGEIQVVGATTFSEYRKNIERDAALERRFQPVKVEEPSVEDTVRMLCGVKHYYEDFHGVQVSDGLVRRAVVLSERYITDRFLPDKAIDLLDEACATAALLNTKADAYADLLLRKERLQQEEESERGSEAVDYERLANLRAELAKLEQELETLRPEALQWPVAEEHMAKVIELWTGIPAAKVQEGELSKLASLETELKRHIIGQDPAVEAVAAAIRRNRVQISPRRRPASFIFVGPTGVGKTELVKVLAAQLFDTPDTLIRMDMSEYMEKHAVSRLIGSPPGYVGYDEAGQLTEKVRQKPYSVLLFDEIEKAHPDVLNLLLQILDEGYATDAHGRKVNFENTVLVMTSNAGSQFKDNLMGFGRSAADSSREKAEKALAEFLRPEFISRVDEIIHFAPLTAEHYARIALLMLSELTAPLSERGITLTWDEQVPAFLAEQAAGGTRGARDLRNAIRRHVEDKIALLIVDRFEETITGIHLSVENDTVAVQAVAE